MRVGDSPTIAMDIIDADNVTVARTVELKGRAREVARREKDGEASADLCRCPYSTQLEGFRSGLFSYSSPFAGLFNSCPLSDHTVAVSRHTGLKHDRHPKTTTELAQAERLSVRRFRT